MALEILFASFIVVGITVIIALVVFLFFVEFSLVQEIYKKMIPAWFLAGFSSILHVFAHLGGEIVFESRLIYVSLNFLAALALTSSLVLMTKETLKAMVLVESGKRLEEEVEKKTKEIREARDYVQAIMNQSPDLVVTLKKDGTINYANKKLAEMTGYTHEEAVGKQLMLEKWEWTTRNESGEYETVLTRKDSGIRYVHVSHVPLKGYDEFLVFLTDITEKRKAERELQHRLQELELFHKVERDRELKMIELKGRIAELEKKIKELEKEKMIE